MKMLLTLIALAGLTLGAVGCTKTDAPKTNGKSSPPPEIKLGNKDEGAGELGKNSKRSEDDEKAAGEDAKADESKSEEKSEENKTE